MRFLPETKMDTCVKLQKIIMKIAEPSVECIDIHRRTTRSAYYIHLKTLVLCTVPSIEMFYSKNPLYTRNPDDSVSS